MYRKFVKPRKKRLFDFIHSRTSAKIFYHSCGSVYDLVPDFIEEGVDILNPLQRSAAKMDIRRLPWRNRGRREGNHRCSCAGRGLRLLSFAQYPGGCVARQDRLRISGAHEAYLAGRVAEALGKPCPRLVHFPTDLLVKVAPNKASWCGVNFQHNNIFYNDAAKRDLGFTVTIHWVDGMRRSVKWLDDHGEMPSWETAPRYDRIIDAWDRFGVGMTDALKGAGL